MRLVAYMPVRRGGALKPRSLPFQDVYGVFAFLGHCATGWLLKCCAKMLACSVR
jgi:hypothetical protein